MPVEKSKWKSYVSSFEIMEPHGFFERYIERISEIKVLITLFEI